MSYQIANVPLFAQTKTWACWYASAQMLVSYRRNRIQACEMGRPDPSEDPESVVLERANNGLGFTQVETFARRMGLRTVPPMTPTLEALEDWLWEFGPLWFAGLWPSGHVVVITGITPNSIQINDPWPVNTGKRGSISLQKFVDILQPLGDAVLAPNFLHYPG